MRKIASLLSVLMLLCTLAFGQSQTVTGTVSDENGNPVPFATVTETGTKNGTTATADGSFSITIKQGSTLTVTSTGHQAQTLTPTGGTLAFRLTKTGGQLTEVVVTSLGQTQRKDRVGFSATTFNSDQVNRAAPVSPLDGLQGKVAGADISNVGGQPGSSSKIILRGYNSLQGSNQALIVVDGVPFNNSRLGSSNNNLDFGNGLNDLNPNDIESITILKGASATSLYGSRAANGVVLVTTKRGRSGKLKVDFTSSAMFSSVAKIPDFQNTFGQGWNALHYKEENGSWGPKMDGKERFWGPNVDNSRMIKPFSPIEDNVRDFYDEGKELNNTIAVRGGNENSNFYLSYGNVYSDGVLPNDADLYKRNTLSVRGQTKTNKFLASASMNYINKIGRQASSNGDEAGSSTFENIIQIARDHPLTDFKDYNNKYFNVDNYFTPYAANPYFSLMENGNRYNNDRFFGNVELGYDFTKWLNIRWRTGVDVTNATLKDWQAVERPKANTWRGPNPTNEESTPYTPEVGGVTERSDYTRELTSDFFVNVNRDLTSDLNLTGFVGMSFNERSARAQTARVTDLTIPGYYNIKNSANDPITDAAYSKRRLIGSFAQANLGFKDFLFLSLNGRYDWSSTLLIGNNDFFYPGANLSLVVSKLLNLDKAKISYFKLRGAYGRTGNDAPPYSLESVLASGNVGLGFGNLIFPLNNVSAFELANQIGNSTLQAEITTELELGTELRFFDNRLGFDFSWYNKKTDGQIIAVPVASSTGYTSLVTNFGVVQNKGVELVVTMNPVRSRDFNWNISGTFTRNRNKILELPEGLDKVDFTSYFDIKMVGRVGQPMGIIEAPTRLTTADGKWVTANGFFVPTAVDNSLGNVNRDYIMGLNNNLSYKNFSLGFTFDYRRGGYFVSRTADLVYFTGNSLLTQYNDRRPFIIPNSVVETGKDAQGKPIYAENTSVIDMTNINSYWYHTSNKPFAWENIVLPKDFLKLRDVTLSYTLPKALSGKISSDNITITAIARNFLLWTPQKNTFIDPEISDLGNDFISEFGEQAAAPSNHSYGLALRVNF